MCHSGSLHFLPYLCVLERVFVCRMMGFWALSIVTKAVLKTAMCKVIIRVLAVFPQHIFTRFGFSSEGLSRITFCFLLSFSSFTLAVHEHKPSLKNLTRRKSNPNLCVVWAAMRERERERLTDWLTEERERERERERETDWLTYICNCINVCFDSRPGEEGMSSRLRNAYVYSAQKSTHIYYGPPKYAYHDTVIHLNWKISRLK